MRLNLGCGSQYVKNWCNVDYSLGARFFKIPLFRALNKKFKLFNLEWHKDIFLHDLTEPFPWADNSVSVVYSSHTLEHFSKEDGRFFLEECRRVLKPNGIIRIVVPDLRYCVNDYIAGRILADDFIENLGVLYGKPSSAIKKLLTQYYQFPHKCMYDTPRLLAILEEIGFDSASKSCFESDIEDITSIERADRTENAVLVEGRKR